MAFVMIPTNLKHIINHSTQSITPMIERRELAQMEAEAAIHKETIVTLERNCFLGLLPSERKQIHLLGHHDLDVNDRASAARFAHYLVHVCYLPEDTRVIRLKANHFNNHATSDALDQYLQIMAIYLREQGYYTQIICDDTPVKIKRMGESIEEVTNATITLQSDIAIAPRQRSPLSLFKATQSAVSNDEADDDDIEEELFSFPS